MIQLPTLQVTRDELEEVRLTHQAKTWLEADERTPGWHASDMLDPRKAYWQRVRPFELSERQVWLFVIGKVLHHFILDMAGGAERGQTDSGSRQAESGILYSADDWTPEGAPIELKTNRSPYEPALKDLVSTHHNYLEQLLLYMAFSGKTEGHLHVLHINLKTPDRRTFPEPRCYRVDATPQGLQDILTQVDTTLADLEHAVAEQSHTHLPLCRTWLCGESCPWWHPCAPEGRYGISRTKWRTDNP